MINISKEEFIKDTEEEFIKDTDESFEKKFEEMKSKLPGYDFLTRNIPEKVLKLMCRKYFSEGGLFMVEKVTLALEEEFKKVKGN